MENPKHFVLVHGICHGAWCWYKLVTLLQHAGHRVTALDLGASGINSKQLHEITSVWNYVQPLMEFMASISHEREVILVGHSYGGLPISLAMESFPQKVLAAVFVTAYMPHYNSPPGVLIQEYFKGTPVESLLDCELKFGQNQENPLTSVVFGPHYMAEKLFQQCKPEDLELAKMLVRPSGLFLEDFMTKECQLTEPKFGSVTRVFVVCEGDEVVKEEFQRWMIENGPTAQVILIREAGHMVMLSKPEQLCGCLCEVAEKIS
ncbi:methylesterase 10-like [Prunus yedoensis var. nudiflora]|uniref:(S)-hydroxynitrile lyase n=1 Tax=Prunus yedoensis var. nudiflora TaxID=2094558 RepID=A0A314Y8U2_PRUYE|nr:methylesterase 10-like [Prunus yedoensis var. nudiflora]